MTAPNLSTAQLLELLAQQLQQAPSVTIAELVPRYMEHARSYYVKNGRHTAEVHRAEIAGRALLELFPDTSLSEFGPLKMKAVREYLIGTACRTDRRARSYVNQLTEVVRRMFKWATSEEICPGGVYQALQCVGGLKRGRSKARETDPVKPVDVAIVEATLPHLAPIPAAMVRLQLLTGCRPGEVCQVRKCDIDTSRETWVFTPQSHKCEHHGKARRIPIGPQGQAILEPFLIDCGESEFIFSPRKAEALRSDELGRNRQTPRWPSHMLRNQKKRLPPEDRQRGPADRYSTASYRRVIQRACEVAFEMPRHLRANQIYLRCLKLSEPEKSEVGERLRVEANAWRDAHVWHPNQLRHTAATLLRQQFGIDAASVILGHSSLVVTMTYAEADLDRALEVMQQYG